MKALTLKSLGTALALALAGAACAAAVWVAATTQGTRWLLESLIPLSGFSFTAQKIEGSISAGLILTNVQAGLSQRKLEIDRLELRMKPLLLLMGAVAVQELVIHGVRIQDDTPRDGKPPIPGWPQLSGRTQRLDAFIARLMITDFNYRRLQEQPLRITVLSGSVTWQGGALSITDFTGVSPSGRVQGALSAGFNKPSLTADLAVDLAQPRAEMNRFTLKAGQSRDQGPEQLTVMVTLTGSAGARKLLEIRGDVGIAHDAFNLRRLRLNRPGQKGRITADGVLAFTTPEPVLTLEARMDDLNLAPELNIPTNLSGSLRFVGTPDSYRGDFTLANQARGWQACTVSAAYQGTSEGLNMTPLNAGVIGGTLSGTIAMNWHDGFTMQGEINGRNLDPAGIAPEWKGAVNFNASGNLAKTGMSPLSGGFSVTLPESRLHGQALTGELRANFSGNNLTVSRLLLHGKGFNLSASGELNQRITLAAAISDLSRLVPGSAGTIQAEGWLRWRDAGLSGAVTGTGNRIGYAGTSIAAASVTARLDQGAGYPLLVTASLRDVAYEAYKLDTVSLEANGTVKNHLLNAAFRSGDRAARLTLKAGYDNGFWKGEINRLAGSDNSGPWNQTAPAAFAVSAGNIYLSPLSISAGASERLEVAADLSLNPPSGRFSAQWAALNLSRFKPWLPSDTSLDGRISGQARGALLAGKRFELDGTAALSGGTVRRSGDNGELKLAFSSATGSWGWRGEALSGTVTLAMTEHGQARASFKLPIPARFPVAVNPGGPLQAKLAGQVREKGIITTLFPGLVQESSGELDVDVDISGTWETPQTGGKLRLTRAGAYLPTAGIHVKDLQLAARLEKNLILIDSFRAISGPGHIEGTALITLSGWRVSRYQGTIRGKNFQTVNFPELRFLSSPNLSFDGTPQKLSLRGELALPELNIVGSQSRTAIAPSSDVIREGKPVPAPKSSPLILDVRIRVLPGEKVFVKVGGIDAQLGGGVDLTFSSFDRITSRGEIKVVKGRYRTYGVNLEIVRGRLFFAGDSIEKPALDFLALRTIGEVRAGVTVAGNLRRPVTRLYSEPAMPDVDILSYIVLGHPLGSSSQQAGLVARAAGVLLNSKQAGVMQEQIKNRLGLSTLEIRGGVGGTTGSMGYKPLQVTPPGSIPSEQQSGITETVLTVGKYLTPQLYISYGKSLFTGSNIFRLRYDIYKQWQIETQTGNGESGADLYYKMEFK